MTSPAAILAKALKPYHQDRPAFADLIKRAGVNADSARRACVGAPGQPTNAETHLRLCAVIGVDPVTGKRVPAREPMPILDWFFAMGLRGHRIMKHHTMQQAATAMGLSLTTVHRLERGNIRSFQSVLAACRYMGAHPNGYVSHETGREKILNRDAA